MEMRRTPLLGLPVDQGGWIFLGILAAAVILVPVLNLATLPDSLLHLPTYVVTLLGKYLCYALLAVAVDLVWGYCGILSLGHGAFFALGGYGHVSDAPDRHARGLWQCRTA